MSAQKMRSLILIQTSMLQWLSLNKNVIELLSLSMEQWYLHQALVGTAIVLTAWTTRTHNKTRPPKAMWIMLCVLDNYREVTPKTTMRRSFPIFIFPMEHIQNENICIIGLWVERLSNELILYGSTLFTVDWKGLVLHTGSTRLFTL